MNYQIVIQKSSFYEQVESIKPSLIIVDSNVQLDSIDVPVVYVETSEETKDFNFYFRLLNTFYDFNLNRTDTVMFVGGGVLIDVASFAASTYKRGINYINVPTTTLSMIDSSVGSKNGLNYLGSKNLIGNITDPSRVIIDVDFLNTLDKRNYNNGIAEAIKIGYLSNDDILNHLEKSEINIEQVIKLSVDEKLSYVKLDKQDYGYRNYLNFGHTFGHAIESITNFNTYYHGEAVSIGMVIASGYDEYLIKLLEKFNLPTKLPLALNIDQLIEYMKNDKKNTSDKIKVILKNPTKQIVELNTNEIHKLINKQICLTNKFATKEIKVNSSKSYLHRVLALCLATQNKVKVDFDKTNDLSEDVIQSINILKDSGATVDISEDNLYVDATNLKKADEYYVKKSATTYRLFAPILCGLFGPVVIKLDEQLSKRPHPVYSPYINGNVHNIPVNGEKFTVDGSISSQFISGYIIAAIACNKHATIVVNNQITSAPYIDMTIEVARLFGIQLNRDNNIVTIESVNRKESISLPTIVDYSSLAYIIVFNKLASIHNKQFRIDNKQIQLEFFQADSIINDILDDEVVDMTNCPDLLPTLVMYGLLNKRGLVLENIDRIKYKECDRVQVMIDNYADLEAIKRDGNNLVIKSVTNLSGRNINTHGDHRIALASAIASPFSDGPVIIDDYTVVAKSFPTFWTQFIGDKNESIE